jgi:glycine/serine hydroxymethyltransferase
MRSDSGEKALDKSGIRIGSEEMTINGSKMPSTIDEKDM